MAAITTDQLNALLQTQWGLYQLQAAYGIGDVLRPAMDAVQRQTRALAAGPVPPPVVLLASFFARAAVSQNCAWVLITPEETGAVLAAYGAIVHDYIQFYTVGGSGGLGVAERPDGAGGYFYIDREVWLPDVGGAADARVAAIAASQDPPRHVPRPIAERERVG